MIFEPSQQITFKRLRFFSERIPGDGEDDSDNYDDEDDVIDNLDDDYESGSDDGKND